MINKIQFIFAAFVVLTIPLKANIEVTEISGLWSSTTGGYDVTGVGTDSINWGLGANGPQRSGYIFQPAPVTFPVAVDTPFELGTFTHNNFPIFFDAISQATLTTDFKFSIDNQEVLANAQYTFLHDETENTGGGCCNDIVTAINNNLLSDTILINGLEYQVNIKGFQTPNGQLLNSFSTIEGLSNSAKLIGEINRFDPNTPVPEPSTYLILSSLLFAAWYLKRRKLASEV